MSTAVEQLKTVLAGLTTEEEIPNLPASSSIRSIRARARTLKRRGKTS